MKSSAPSLRHTILVLDDNSDVVESVQLLLHRDFRVLGATRVRDALRLLDEEDVQVIMTDQRMPEMSGVEFLTRVRGRNAEAVRLLFTAYADIPSVVSAVNLGEVHRYIAKPWDPEELLAMIRQAAERYDLLAERKRLLTELQAKNRALEEANAELAEAYDSTLEGWSRALELRDQETDGHTRRVTEMTLFLARAMGMSGDELIHVRRGALLHDIGKMAIPDGILLKAGPLSEKEWSVMRHHPTYAHDLLAPIRYLWPAMDIPYCHHERWDGTGYPRGLKGEEIPLAARIFAVVDAWDALRSDRPYHRALPEAEVRSQLRALAGTQFDPKVVEAFLRVLGER
jgi:response regulator RpfG family c-di-GMP phosphodiesterase